MDSAETSGRCLCPNGNAAVSLASEQQKRSHNILRRQHFGFYDGSNPQDCINSCRKSFFSLLLDAATSENDSTDTTPPQVCSLLSSPGVGDILWQLYWCDSAFCGVWIEAGTSGQDPNVDLVINQCQNIGYSSVYDPGSPASDYSCSSLLTAVSPGNPCHIATASTTSASSSSIILTTPAVAMASSHVTRPSPAPTALATATAQSSATSPHSTATGSSPPLTATTQGTSQLGNSLTASSRYGPSPGIKAAIVVCVIIGFLLLAGLVFFFLRRRRKNRGNGGRNNNRNRNNRNYSNNSNSRFKSCLQQSQLYFFPNSQQHSGATGEPPTPLISPAHSRNSAASSARPSSLTGGGGTFGTAYSTYGAHAGASSTTETWPVHPPRDHRRGRSRLLPAMLFRRGTSRGTSPPLTSLSPPPSPTTGGGGGSGGFYGYTDTSIPYYFPSSPICAPTTNKLEPRREATPTLRAGQRSSREMKQKQQKQQQQQRQQQQQQQQKKNRNINHGSHRTAPPPPTSPISLSLSLSPILSGDGGPSVAGAGRLRSKTSSRDTSSTITDSGACVQSLSSSSPSSPAGSASIYGHALTTDAVDPMVVLPAVISPYYGGGGGPASVSPSSALSTRNFSPGMSPPPLPPPHRPSFSPKSPSRPPRPHETPLEIPDLVMPDTPLPAASPLIVKTVRTSTSSPFFSSTATLGGSRDRTRDSRGDGDGEFRFSLCAPPNRALPPLPLQSPPASPPRRPRTASTALRPAPPLLMRDDDVDDYAWASHKYQSATTSTEPREGGSTSAVAAGSGTHTSSFSSAATASTLTSTGVSGSAGEVLSAPSSPASVYSTTTDSSDRTVRKGKVTHGRVALYAPATSVGVSES